MRKLITFVAIAAFCFSSIGCGDGGNNGNNAGNNAAPANNDAPANNAS